VVCVDAHDGVEEAASEGKLVGFRMDRKNSVRDLGIADPLMVRRCVDPKVSSPDFRTELPGQEDRRHRLAAAEVEDAHSLFDRHDLGKRLEQPERVWAHLIVKDPLRVVGVRTAVARVVEKKRPADLPTPATSRGPGQR
jgi:hypothetical protein